MNKYNQVFIVKEVTPELMYGDTPLEKKLNAYLTRNIIFSHDVPADECLSEAKYLIQAKLSLDEIEAYLISQFGPVSSPKTLRKEAEGVFKLLTSP